MAGESPIMLFFCPGNYGAIVRHLVPQPNEVGWLLSPQYPMTKYKDKLKGFAYGIDNQCYAQADKFNFERFLKFLGRVNSTFPTDGCKYVVVPDTVGDATATHKQWIQYAPAMREIGLPLGYVAQDGLTRLPNVEFDALFIGGSTEYKLSTTATALIRDAKQRGKWVHMGRVNGTSRITHAWLAGCDSVDGSGVAQSAVLIIKFVNHLRWLAQQQRMIL